MSSEMEEVPIAAADQADRQVRQVLERYDAPAFSRRAKQVEAALAELCARCAERRREDLALVGLRLAQLLARAGDWAGVAELVDDAATVAALRAVYDDLQPRLRDPVVLTHSLRKRQRALAELAVSVEHFNRRWGEFLRGLDLGPVNALIEGYNRFYLLEKECMVRSPQLARLGFQRLERVTVEDVARRYPTLPVPRPRAAGSPAAAEVPSRTPGGHGVP
jgi:hypothetical protein